MKNSNIISLSFQSSKIYFFIVLLFEHSDLDTEIDRDLDKYGF